MKNFIYSIILLLIANPIIAQQALKGRIIDGQTGEPLAGASIRIKNTATAVISGKSGEFLIKSPGAVGWLTISFVGYKTQQLNVNSNTGFMNIEMQTGMASLNHVTVTGYENNRKLLETAGSIAIITSKEIQRGNNLSILPVLNTVPGVKMEEAAPGNIFISALFRFVRTLKDNIQCHWESVLSRTSARPQPLI